MDVDRDLIAKINAAHLAACGDAHKAIEHAAECGRLLLEAKKPKKHGEWLPWLKANTHVEYRTAAKYMQLANRWSEIEVAKAKVPSGAYLTINGALDMVAKPRNGKKHKHPTAEEILAGRRHAAGEPRDSLAEETGIGAATVERSKYFTVGYDDGFADGIASTTPLSKNAEQKVAAAIRYRLRELEAALEERLAAEKQTWIDRFKKVLADAQTLQEGRRGLITKQEAMNIKRALHPDNSASPETRNKAFVTWTA